VGRASVVTRWPLSPRRNCVGVDNSSSSAADRAADSPGAPVFGCIASGNVQRMSHVLERPDKIAFVDTGRPPSRAAMAVGSYLSAQAGGILDGVAGLRCGEDQVHDTRVALRRLRSTMRVFRRLLDDGAGDLDEDLKWFSALLGSLRDCQVQRHRLQQAVDELPDELVLGPVGARIASDLRRDESFARTRVAEAMDSPRYQDLIAELQSWRGQPSVCVDGSRGQLMKKAQRAGEKADRRLAAALAGGDDASLHRARKAAKRARYAHELIKQVSHTRDVKATIKRYRKIQRVCGDHQDTVITVGWLRHAGAVAGTTPGENGFTFGLLCAREQSIGRRSRRRAGKLRP